MENEVSKETPAGVSKEADAVGRGVTRNAVSQARCTEDGEGLFSRSGLGAGRKDWLDGAVSCLKHKWDCSQVEDDVGEGDGMDWSEEDGWKELTS